MFGKRRPGRLLNVICTFNLLPVSRGILCHLRPCLNLYSWRWLKSRRNLVNSFIPYGLQISKILLGGGLVNFKSLFLKNLIFSKFLTSRLVKSAQLLKKEKRSSKKRCLILSKGILPQYLVFELLLIRLE